MRFQVKTHCPHGHEYTPDNTMIRVKNGKPYKKCKICHRRDAKRARLKIQRHEMTCWKRGL